MPTLRLLLSLCAALALAGAARPMAAQPEGASPPPTTGPRYVIPPGQEPLLADMLGRGQGLPSGCKLTDGRIDRSVIVATYDCDGGQVVIDLHHPDDAPSAAVRSERFALAVRTGTSPEGLTAAILDRIRAREDEFAWTSIGGSGSEGKGGRRLAPVAAAVVAVAALIFWLARRIGAKRRARDPGPDGAAAP